MRQFEVNDLPSAQKTSREKLLAAMEKSGIFSGFPDAADKADILSFEPGETVFECSGEKKALGLVVSGRLTVMRTDGGSEVVLNTISSGGCFGVSTLFCRETPGAPTRVVAKSRSTAAFFSDSDIADMITSNGAFALSYVSFLTDRIRFLNSRITDFTGGSASARLAGELLRSEENGLTVSSYAQLARTLDVGRASLYRALDELSEAGVIAREGKAIIILDRNALKLRVL